MGIFSSWYLCCIVKRDTEGWPPQRYWHRVRSRLRHLLTYTCYSYPWTHAHTWSKICRPWTQRRCPYERTWRMVRYKLIRKSVNCCVLRLLNYDSSQYNSLLVAAKSKRKGNRNLIINIVLCKNTTWLCQTLTILENFKHDRIVFTFLKLLISFKN